MTAYIFVTGGVVSGLGKGVTAASIGRLLKSRGVRVSIQKLDPYLNVDPGTMSPYQHGEVFVTDDGAETDLDLGHYERFIDENLSQANNVTTGQIYNAGARQGAPRRLPGRHDPGDPARHQRDQARASQDAGRHSDADVVIVEVGGTVGDIEGLPFLEAIRQMRKDVGRNHTFYIHVTLLPYISGSNELKTKPTQHSVRELRGIGIQPDMIVCRSDQPVSQGVREKIALFTDVEPRAVVPAYTARQHLRSAADAGGRGRGRLHRRAAGAAASRRPTWRSGGGWSIRSASPSRRSRLRWSASTSSWKTPT